MLVKSIGPLLLSTLLSSAGAPAARSAPDVPGSCAELVRARQETEAATARLADWMDRHCPGSLEVTEPFCRLQSRALMEHMAELGELKAALAAKRCELREARNAGPRGPRFSVPPRGHSARSCRPSPNDRLV